LDCPPRVRALGYEDAPQPRTRLSNARKTAALNQQDLEPKRRSPRQARSRTTVATILEAAAQVLERAGEAGFNTNAVADRAGISVGTLYRYFPNKRAVIHALALAECDRLTVQVTALLADVERAPAERRKRAVHAYVRAFEGRLRVRRAVLRAVAEHPELVRSLEDFIGALSAVDGADSAFVHTHAVIGATRAAVLARPEVLGTEAFERQLLRLVGG